MLERVRDTIHRITGSFEVSQALPTVISNLEHSLTKEVIKEVLAIHYSTFERRGDTIVDASGEAVTDYHHLESTHLALYGREEKKVFVGNLDETSHEYIANRNNLPKKYITMFPYISGQTFRLKRMPLQDIIFLHVSSNLSSEDIVHMNNQGYIVMDSYYRYLLQKQEGNPALLKIPSKITRFSDYILPKE
ncbi:MAG: hypothetical protein ABIO02_03795 [Patescibacteria group bacterium]